MTHLHSGWRALAPAVASLALLLCPAPAPADETEPGKAKLGIEYELENGARNAWQSRSLTLVPGITLDNPWIHMVEALIEGAHEHDSGERSTERKLAIRLRHNFTLGPDTRLVLRALAGHAVQGDEKYFYWYAEPSFRYAIGPVELMLGYRHQRALDAGKDHDLHKLRLGPSFELSENTEIEFRWARSWNMHTGAHVSDAYIVEGTWRF